MDPYKDARMPATAHRRTAVSAAGFDLDAYLRSRTESVNGALDRFLPKASARPATIHKAMRYSLFAGGKRIRPALALAAAEACGGSLEDALPAACAVWWRACPKPPPDGLANEPAAPAVAAAENTAPPRSLSFFSVVCVSLRIEPTPQESLPS